MGEEGPEGPRGLGLQEVKKAQRLLTRSPCLRLSSDSGQKLGPRDLVERPGVAGPPDQDWPPLTVTPAGAEGGLER